MQSYEFRSMDGICLKNILLTFSILLRKEETNYKYPTCLNRNEYVWIIGNNVYLRLKYLNNSTEFNMTELKRLTGIDVIRLVPGDRPNCIILKKKKISEKTCGNCANRDVYGHCIFQFICGGAKSPTCWTLKTEPSKSICGNVAEYCDTDIIATETAFRYLSAAKKYKEKENVNMSSKIEIKKVIFNDPVTVVLWSDRTKTIVKAENESFDPEKGLAMAICKKFLGTNKNKSNYYDIFKNWLPKEEPVKTIYLTAKELADKLGVSKSTIIRMINNDAYPEAKKINGRWMIPFSNDSVNGDSNG